MHEEQCFHRDIAPDNILLTDRGPLLLDFGAARRVIGDMTHALTVVLKPGYAPIEQYGEAASMAQGPWTDLYALASVVYYAITGSAPLTSVERIMEDRLEPLAVTAAGRYSEGFLHAIDAALAVRPAERPQNVPQFRELLDAGLAPDARSDYRRPAPSLRVPRLGLHRRRRSIRRRSRRATGRRCRRRPAAAPATAPVTAVPAMATRRAPSRARATGSGPTRWQPSVLIVGVAALLAVG